MRMDEQTDARFLPPRRREAATPSGAAPNRRRERSAGTSRGKRETRCRRARRAPRSRRAAGTACARSPPARTPGAGARGAPAAVSPSATPARSRRTRATTAAGSPSRRAFAAPRPTAWRTARPAAERARSVLLAPDRARGRRTERAGGGTRTSLSPNPSAIALKRAQRRSSIRPSCEVGPRHREVVVGVVVVELGIAGEERGEERRRDRERDRPHLPAAPACRGVAHRPPVCCSCDRAAARMRSSCSQRPAQRRFPALISSPSSRYDSEAGVELRPRRQAVAVGVAGLGELHPVADHGVGEAPFGLVPLRRLAAPNPPGLLKTKPSSAAWCAPHAGIARLRRVKWYW